MYQPEEEDFLTCLTEIANKFNLQHDELQAFLCAAYLTWQNNAKTCQKISEHLPHNERSLVKKTQAEQKRRIKRLNDCANPTLANFIEFGITRITYQNNSGSLAAEICNILLSKSEYSIKELLEEIKNSLTGIQNTGQLQNLTRTLCPPLIVYKIKSENGEMEMHPYHMEKLEYEKDYADLIDNLAQQKLLTAEQANFMRSYLLELSIEHYNDEFKIALSESFVESMKLEFDPQGKINHLKTIQIFLSTAQSEQK